MNSGGSPVRRIDDGWGASWSPDGESIAYTNDNSIRVFDVASGESSVLLSKKDHPYRYLHPNLTWSPDSKRIAFHGALDRHLEIAILSIEEPFSLRRRYQSTDDSAPQIGWSDGGKTLLFSAASHRYGKRLIYQLDMDGNGPATLYSASGTETNWEDVVVGRGGKFLFATTFQ